MTEQSTLFGDDRPDDLSLGVTQRNVMRALRDLGPMGRAEIGAVIHATRGRHDIDEICPRCGIDAGPVIASLKDRGLVERAPEGDIRPVEPARTVRNPSTPIQEETT